MDTLQAILCACRIALATLASAILMPLARADDDRREYVPELDAYYKVSERTRLFALANTTKVESVASLKNQVGVHLDITAKEGRGARLPLTDWARARDIWLRVGYRQLRTWDGEREDVSERRGLLELNVNSDLRSGLRITQRLGFDQRDLSGKSSQRYRYRLGIERALSLVRTALVPYARAEVFYDTRYSAWSRQRYQVGTEIDLTTHWRLEPYLALDRDTQPDTVYTDRIGMIVKFYW